MTNLNKQVAVVTGASSGIGAATARKLASLGMRLVITARREKRLQELAAATGAKAIAGDLTDPALPARLLQAALDQYGRCDVVVNNAGVMVVGTVADADIEAFCRMVRTNVEGAYRIAYTFARHFLAQKYGHLINVSSILGTKVRPGAGAYAGTKYAIEALTEALRMELAGTGVGVSAVEPALVLTELHDHWDVHPKDSLGIKKPLLPEDIANAIAFVLQQPPHVRIPRILVMPEEQSL